MPPKFAVFLTFIVSLTFFLVGYDFMMVYTSAFIQENIGITNDQNLWFLYTIDAYSVVGAFAAGLSANKIGRKYTIIIAGACFFIGYLLMCSVIHYVILMIGRVLVGIGSGISLVVAPIYIVEASPFFSRESMTKYPELFLCFGTLVGIFSQYFCSKISNKMMAWRLMMGLGLIPSSALLVAMMFLPESPTWLYMHDEIADATRVLKLTSSNNDDEVSSRLDVMSLAIEDNIESGTWKTLFSPNFRRVSISIIALHFCQQVVSMEIIVGFSGIIIGFAVPFKPYYLVLCGSIIICIRIILLFFFTFLGVRIGRRISLLVTVTSATICLVFTGIIFLLYFHNIFGGVAVVGLSASFVATFTVMFAIGLGPVTWIYGIEILPYPLRSRGVSVGVMSNRMTRALFTSLVPQFIKGFVDGGGILTYGGLLGIGFILCYIFYRETSVRVL